MTVSPNALKVEQFEKYETEVYTLFYQSLGPLQMDYGMQIFHNGGATQFACAEAPHVTLLNRLLGLGISKPATQDEIERAVKRAGTLKVSLAAGVVDGVSCPANLAAMLNSNGFAFKSRTGVLYYEPGTPPPDFSIDPAVSVEQVVPGQTDKFVEVVCEGFELRGGFRRVWEAITRASVSHPQQKCYIAFIDGQPAGGATLVFSKDRQYCGLYSTSTMPEFRHHGVQSALLLTMLIEALNSRVSVITAQAPYDTSAQRNLERLNFKVGYIRDIYLNIGSV